MTAKEDRRKKLMAIFVALIFIVSALAIIVTASVT
jgi:hypothetical protein